MFALLAVLLPCSVLVFTTNLRAISNIITVNTLSDASTSGDGLCSLREAINNAKSASDTADGDCAAGTGTDTIDFSVSGSISLNRTLPAITQTSTGKLTSVVSRPTSTSYRGTLFGRFGVPAGANHA